MKTGRLAGGSDTTYVYNALGQRVKKSGGAIASPLYFMYDEAGHLVGEYDSSGNLIQETVWLGDIPVATLRPNGANVDVFYVHTDQLNTPRKVTRPSDNALRWRWDPTPFGEGVPDQNPASIGTFVYNLRFPGQQFDVETNLNYNYFRDYDPTSGRYVEKRSGRIASWGEHLHLRQRRTIFSHRCSWASSTRYQTSALHIRRDLRLELAGKNRRAGRWCELRMPQLWI